MKEWIIKNWKELLFFLLTWGIGWVLFSNVICCIIIVDPSRVIAEQWTIFYTSLFLLLLPFVSKISLGNIIKIEREIKQAKKDLNDFRTNVQSQFQFLTSNFNILSQNVSNRINIYYQVPSAEKIKEEKDILDSQPINMEGNREDSEAIINDIEKGLVNITDEWIFNLLKIRIQMEQFLRSLLDKRISGTQNTNIKFKSLKKLFEEYVDLYPAATVELKAFELFENVANAVIHGQIITESQYQQASELGIKVLRNIKIRHLKKKNL